MDKLSFQSEIVERIDASSNNSRLFHSYIFSGSSNSGQMEVANHFAKKVVKDYNGDSHPNVFKITTEKQNIGKEQVLEMAYEMHTTSMSGSSKVFIIENAEKLSVSAQNSLLKIIEEPEGSSYVIFIVENTNQLLSTIVSRSQIINFKPLPFELIYDNIYNNYENKLKLKYAVYLDNSNYDELYNDEEFDIYLDVVFNYINVYFIKNEQSIYELEEICYSKIKDKKMCLIFLKFLIINIETIIANINTKAELFDHRVVDATKKCDSNLLVRFLEKTFICYDMVNSNVNIKLALDKLTSERK